jgi:hypothetical protein
MGNLDFTDKPTRIAARCDSSKYPLVAALFRQITLLSVVGWLVLAQYEVARKVPEWFLAIRRAIFSANGAINGAATQSAKQIAQA